jgi:hypothetical protein
LTNFAHAVAPNSSSVPSWANGPDVAAISQMTMGEFADPPFPLPELQPAATVMTRTALAAALPTTRSRRERYRTLVKVEAAFLEKRRAAVNWDESIKAPFGFAKDRMPDEPLSPHL